MLEIIVFPTVISVFPQSATSREALKAPFGSDSLSLCHKVIRLVSEQICPGVLQ